MSDDVYDVGALSPITQECPNCGASFPSWVGLDDHGEEAIGEEESCPGCGAELPERQDYTGRL